MTLDYFVIVTINYNVVGFSSLQCFVLLHQQAASSTYAGNQSRFVGIQLSFYTKLNVRQR
jgi:hypothetical protein